MQTESIIRLAILEDDEFQIEIYQTLFSQTLYQCEFFRTVAVFLEAVEQRQFDLFIIDWMLPDGTAEDALKWIRSNLDQHIPVICVTARNAESDVVHVLNLGADDYFIKSTRNSELLARVEALVHRIRAQQPAMFRFGPYEVNYRDQQINLSGKNVNLTHKEFDLAGYLFQNPNKLLSRIHLLDKIWGMAADIDTRTVDTHVSRIRRKLDLSRESGWDIVTVYGYGYRLQSDEHVKSTH